MYAIKNILRGKGSVMRLKKIVFSIVISISFISSAFSLNNDNDEFNTSIPDDNYGAKSYHADNNLGFYGEVEAGSANTSSLNSGIYGATAGRIALGYKWDSYMGFELGTTGLSNPSGGDTLAQIQFYDVAFVGTLPISNWFDFHGQVGMSYASMTAQEHENGIINARGANAEFLPMLGVGLDVYVTRSFALTMNDYGYFGGNQNGVNSLGNTNIVMGGLKYNF